MKILTLVVFVVFFSIPSRFCVAESISGGKAETKTDYEIIRIGSDAGVAKEAAYFHAAEDKVVVFVPGAVFDKESWFFLAERLQKLHVASLSLDGKTGQDVLAAVDVLKEKGFKQIILVGGSMGGAAVLAALEDRQDERISKVILLAPAGGKPIQSDRIEKLFIVSKKDNLGFVSSLCEHSSEPKKLVALDGSAHAQHIFRTDQREALIKLIIEFVVEES